MSDPSTSFSLLERAQANDEQAWGQLVNLYAPLMARWCKQAGLQESDAADVFQESFRAVSRKLESFQPRHNVGSFRAWLKMIVRRKIIDHVRKIGNHPGGLGGSVAQQQFANVADPLGHESVEDAQAENALIVRQAMEVIRLEFTVQNWLAFQKVAVEGQPASEVAADLNVNASAVRQANYRIRRRLRTVLQDLIEE